MSPRRRKRTIQLPNELNVYLGSISCSCPNDDHGILRKFSRSFLPKDLATIINRAKTKGDAVLQLVLTLLGPSHKSIALCGKGRERRISPLAHYGLSCIPRKGALVDKAVQSGLLLKGPRTARTRLRTTLRATITSFIVALPRKLSALYNRRKTKLDRNRTRQVTVTHNLLHPKDVLLLSRPASSLSRRARQGLLRQLSQRMRSGALVLVARQRAVTRLYASTMELRGRST